jgi:hypothetical protein
MREAVAALLAQVLETEVAMAMRTRRRRPADADALALEVERLLCNVAALRLAGVDHMPLAISVNRRRATSGGSHTRNGLLAVACNAGLLEPAGDGGILPNGMQVPSQWRAWRPLLSYLPHDLDAADLRLERSEEPPLVVRSIDGLVLPLPPQSVPLADRVREVNAWTSSLPVTLRSGTPCAWVEVPRDGFLPRVSTPQHLTLYRTFTASLDRGGRLYGGFWIHAPKAWRFRNLLLAGEPIGSCDYREMFLRLAYRHHGITWPFDDGECAYTAGPGQRDGWKAMTNALLAAHRIPSRWPERTPADTAALRARFTAGTTVAEVVARIRARHSAVDAAGAFGVGLGGLLTRRESDLAVALLLACRDAGLPALPVHDCLLVPRSRTTEAAQLMRDVSARVAGVRLPVSVEHGGSYV